MDMISIRRKLMATVKQSTVILATATGNPLSFVTDMVRPLKSLVIPFTPIQAAGTPSPDNPLPISGWTGCEITHTGKNLVGVNTLELGLFNPTTGEAEDSTTVFRSKHKIPVAPGETFTMSISGTRARIWPAIYWWDANGNYINRSLPTANVTTFTATAPANARWMGFHQSIGSLIPSIDAFVNTYKAQWEKGASRTVYEPHQGETIQINWQTEAGTVYGGTLTLNEDGSADLVSTFKAFHLGSYNWRADTAASNTHLFYVDGWDSLGITDGTKYCSILLPTTTLNLSNWRGVNGEGKIGHGGSRLYIKPMTVSTAADAKVLMNGQYFIGTLNTPQTYHFDNIGQFITFLGTNTIWTDTNGTNTVTYLKHQS